MRDRRRRQDEHIEEGRTVRGRIVAIFLDFSANLLLLPLQQLFPETRKSSTPEYRV